MEFFDAVSEAIGLVLQYSRTYYYSPLECKGTDVWYTTMKILLIPAIIWIILLSFSIRRKRMLLDKLGGRPALIYPMSVINRFARLSYIACFGAISPLIFRIVVESKEAIDYEGPTMYSSLITLVSMLIYSIIAFPIFASVTVNNVLGYGLGTLYVWAFTVINIFSNFDCPDMSVITKVAYNLESLPQTVSLIYLSFRIPHAFVLELLRWYSTGEFEAKPTPVTIQFIKQSYVGTRVSALLVGVRKRSVPASEPVTCSEKTFAWVCKMCCKWVYERDATFQFSNRILTTLWIGFTLLFYITFKFIWKTTSYSLYILDIAIYTLDNIGWSDQTGESDVKKMARSLIKVYYFGIKTLWGFFIICFVAALFIGTFSIIYSLTMYRENLKAIQRGDFSKIRPRSCKTNAGLLESSMKYAGYQFAYIALAFLIQSVFFILSTTIVVLVIVLLYLGYKYLSIAAIVYLVFWIVAFLLLMISQYVLAKFVFLQDYNESVAIDNRRGLFLLSYVVYFYNVFVGFGSCLLRLCMSLIIGVLNISRLDTSLLPRRFELWDGGYDRYLGFMHVEAYHTHHVMLVFVDILKLKHQQTKSKMLGLKEPNEHFSKNKKQGTRFQEAVVRSRMQTSITTLNTSAQSVQLEFPQDSAGVDIQVQETMGSFETTDRVEGDPDSGEVAEVVVDVGSTDIVKVRWEDIRESPEMSKQRRQQAAAFKWLLAYTLMSNPQLKVLRKRRKDAEME